MSGLQANNVGNKHSVVTSCAGWIDDRHCHSLAGKQAVEMRVGIAVPYPVWCILMVYSG